MQYLDLEAITAKHSFSISFLRKLIRNEGCPHYRIDRKIWLEEEEFCSWFASRYRVETEGDKSETKSVDDILASVLDGLKP